MPGAPYYFDQLSTLDSHIIPGTMSPANNILAGYYRRYLAQRLVAIFDFNGAPDTWDLEYLKYTLACFGFAAVIRTDAFGVIPLACGIGGYNVYYRPTRALIANPLFNKTYDLEIGSECEMIRITPDWQPLADIIGHYADLLAITCSSIVTNLYNTKLSYVFSAGTRAMAESFKAMFDKVAQGEPAVFTDKALFREDGTPNWIAFQQDLKGTYLVDMLQQAERTIMNQFFSDIGIPNIPFEKSERLTTNESEVYSYANMCLADLWLRTLQETTGKVNQLFGLNITVDFNDALKEVLTRADDSESDGVGNDGVRPDNLE